MTQEINYQQQIQKGIPIINDWIDKQDEYFKESDELKELQKVLIEIQQDQDFSEDSYEDIRYLLRPIKQLPLQIKRLFNIATLDNYSTFIASRHFETLKDFINLELSTSKFQGNMTKFYYNPISVTKSTMKFFPNIETLHCYSDYDFYLEGGRISQYVEWTRRSYTEMKRVMDNFPLKRIEFKCSVFSYDDVYDQLKNNTQKNTIKIPHGIKEVSVNAFKFESNNVHNLCIPETIKLSSMKNFFFLHNVQSLTVLNPFFLEQSHLFDHFSSLTNLTVSNEYTVDGNCLFLEKNNSLKSIRIPNTLMKINGNFVKIHNLLSYTIPSTVTRLSNYCFAHCDKLFEIIGLDQIKTCGVGCFYNCSNLSNYSHKLIAENRQNHINSIIDNSDVHTQKISLSRRTGRLSVLQRTF